MYTMVLMAAMTTGMDMPDLGRRGGRGGGCCGCYGGMAYGGWGGCYGGYGGYGMGYGGGWGGCYGGGWGGGYGGCYGMGYGGGWGGGYGGYGRGHVMGSSPWYGGGYAYSPMISGYGTPLVANNAVLGNGGATQSFFFNPTNAANANEATIVVHMPAQANLTIEGQPTQQRSDTRTFTSPPLQAGKTYTYTLRAEMNRDGRLQNVKKTVDVQAGQRSEVTIDFNDANREGE